MFPGLGSGMGQLPVDGGLELPGVLEDGFDAVRSGSYAVTRLC